MKKDDAKAGVLQEFRRWRARPGNANELADGHTALLFFNWITVDKPELLAFKTSGDKWQIVHGWLLNAGQISD
jgi:hypothetical protein